MPRSGNLLLVLAVSATACGGAADQTTKVVPGPFAAIAGSYAAVQTGSGQPMPCEIKLSAPIGGGVQFYEFITDAQLTLRDNGQWSHVAHVRGYRGSPGNSESTVTLSGAGTFSKTVGGNAGDYTLEDTVTEGQGSLTFIAPDRFNRGIGSCLLVFQRQ